MLKTRSRRFCVYDGQMTEYKIVDLRAETIEAEPRIVDAKSPEKAAEFLLGLQLVRGGQPHDLRARVYSQTPGNPLTMVRLYERASARRNVKAN